MSKPNSGIIFIYYCYICCQLFWQTTQTTNRPVVRQFFRVCLYNFDQVVSNFVPIPTGIWFPSEITGLVFIMTRLQMTGLGLMTVMSPTQDGIGVTQSSTKAVWGRQKEGSGRTEIATISIHTFVKSRQVSFSFVTWNRYLRKPNIRIWISIWGR